MPIENGEDAVWLHTEVTFTNISSANITIPRATRGSGAPSFSSHFRERKIQMLYLIGDSAFSDKILSPEVYRPIILTPGASISISSTNITLSSEIGAEVSVVYSVEAPIADRNGWWHGRLACIADPLRFKARRIFSEEEANSEGSASEAARSGTPVERARE